MGLSESIEAILAEFKDSSSRSSLARRLVGVMSLVDSDDLVEKISEILDRDLTEEEKYSIGYLKEEMVDSGMFLGRAHGDPIKPSSWL